MEYSTFTVRLPKELVKDLDATAFHKYKKRNCRNQLITEMLADGLHAHAPPINARSISKAPNGHRKNKAAIS